MKLIAFAGKARVGKDTAGTHMHGRHGYLRYAMAGPLKAMLRVGLNLRESDFQTTEQKEAIIPELGFSYRRAAQLLGTEWGRVLHPDLWLLVAERYLSTPTAQLAPGVAITDVRFENEAAWVRKQGGQIVHIDSQRAGEGMSTQAQAHASEAGLTRYPGDWVIRNDSTREHFYAVLDGLLAQQS